jgi:uncharacterized repeat protein (TIGR03803 family)
MKYKERTMHTKNRLKAAAIIRGGLTLAVVSAMLFFAANPVHAQTQQVLYSFGATPDGENPYGGVTFNNNNIFGTTYNGGAYGFGSVYELTSNGSGGYTETVLYNFCPASPSCTDGENPALSSVVFDSNGNLYGTTFNGGANGLGEVFELTPPTTGSTWTETVLYSFAGEPDAANPVNGLIWDASGNLYGTSYNGGGGGNGAVFELSPNGSGGWTEQVAASLSTTLGGLTINSSGDIFVPASASIYELEANGSGGFNPVSIFTFNSTDAKTEGETPNGTLILDSSGNLYGTTAAGGANSDGVIFKLIYSSTKKTYAEKVLYSFGANGTVPYAGVIADPSGNLYGTTTAGGKNGAGIIYELVYNSTKGTYSERNLQTFTGENGAVPYAGLVYNGGYVYGTTYDGGANGEGAVFVANGAAKTTTTTCTSSLNPSTEGTPVTFTATVSPAPPNGEIVVFEPIGQGPMTNGVATFTTSALKVGSTKITAVYGGDLNFITSKSVSFEQVVDK